MGDMDREELLSLASSSQLVTPSGQKVESAGDEEGACEEDVVGIRVSVPLNGKIQVCGAKAAVEAIPFGILDWNGYVESTYSKLKMPRATVGGVQSEFYRRSLKIMKLTITV